MHHTIMYSYFFIKRVVDNDISKNVAMNLKAWELIIEFKYHLKQQFKKTSNI